MTEVAPERRRWRQAGIALAALGVTIVAAAALTTPWDSLPSSVPPDPARDFTPAEIARAQAFDAAVSAPAYLSLGLTVLFAGLLIATPLGARLLGRLRGPGWVRVLLGVLLLTLLVEALRWPLGVWSEIRLREFGLSTQDWASWSVDRLKNIAVRTALPGLLILALGALARRFDRWWIPASAGAFAFTLAASFAYPVLVEPLFNDFRSMPAGRLRSDLLAMAERDGVPVDDVLVADASRRTTALNAYVSGFGATRRIVVYDTLLRAPEAEVELVVAHELGHAKNRDVLYGTLLGGLGAAFGAILLFPLYGLVRRRAGGRPLADPRAAGVLLGLMSLAAVLSGPLQNVVSRQIEARADRDALDLTGDPAAFVAMQRRLAVANLADLSPDLFERLLYGSHPTAPERIAAARAWAREHGLPEP